MISGCFVIILLEYLLYVNETISSVQSEHQGEAHNIAEIKSHADNINDEIKQSINSALKAGLSLIWEEYETLQDDDLKERYDSAIEKLQNAIKQMESID